MLSATSLLQDKLGAAEAACSKAVASTGALYGLASPATAMCNLRQGTILMGKSFLDFLR